MGENTAIAQQQQPLLFGTFNEDDYEKYFGVNAVVHPAAIEFQFDRISNVSDWINQGTWFLSDVADHKAAVSASNDSIVLTINDNDATTPDADVPHLAVSPNGVEEITAVQESNVQCSSDMVNGTLDNGHDLSESPQETDVSKTSKQSTAKPQSWADLFRKPTSATNPVAGAPLVNGPSKSTSPMNDVSPLCQDSVEIVEDHLRPCPSSLGAHVSFQLRGLINSSNWCFINATLQALLSSPKFYPIYATFPTSLSAQAGLLTESMIQFINAFQKLRSDDLPDKPLSVGVASGVPFEPTSIYNCLPASKSSLSEKGRQQDAEEFLSFLLNGLHDELVSLRNKLYPKMKNDGSNLVAAPVKEEKFENGIAIDDEWHHVGPKNKSALTRETQHEDSFITNVFGGMLRSSVRHSGAKESVTLQPFFTLPLDIQPDNAKSVTDALRNFFAKECLQGYTCQKTNSQVDASRKTSLESLPGVLILQLKYFLYDKSGGSQKIHKPVSIPIDLTISRDMMSTTAKPIAPPYTLFAVVYHHGKSAADGHYTAAVRDRSTKQPHLFVHCDDSRIEACSTSDVVQHEHARTPYLLFYERNY